MKRKKRKSIKKIITNLVLVSFILPLGFIVYKIITAHLMFGAYMNDYLLMIIRLSVLSVMFVVFMAFVKRGEDK